MFVFSVKRKVAKKKKKHSLSQPNGAKEIENIENKRKKIIVVVTFVSVTVDVENRKRVKRRENRQNSKKIFTN